MPPKRRTCFGVIEEATYESRKRRMNKPQPWIVLKSVVAITVGIAGYATYVYVGRACKDMITRSADAMGSLAVGVVFLVIYAILLLLVLWSYAKVVCTSPGVARKFAHKTERPGYDPQPQDDRQSHTSTDVRGVPYDQTSVLHVNTPDPTYHHTTTLQKNVALQKHEFQSSWSSRASERSPSKRTSVGNAHESHTPRDTGHNRQSSQTSTSHPTGSIHAIRSSEEARAREASTNPDMTRVVGNSLVPTTVSGQAPLRNKEYIGDHGENGSARNPNSREPARCPPATPTLLPEFRYCSRCKIVKPHRTHHCRSCGTCVLRYDHHCPWIGGCVGAYNQKFFVNFLLWGSLYCWWTFGSLLGLFVDHLSTASTNFDLQVPIVIGLSGLFGVFAVLMLATQIHLILLNQTTVESMAARTIKDREKAALSDAFGWWECGAKRRTRQRWNQEWGRIAKEGNIWWLGGDRENWESVMSKNRWWWFFPVGRCPSDGMNFPVNPRFDAQGRWRRREEWPADLR
ncbi:hypothetical protein SCLCIDRAFT_1132611 [Scleroderma citrinum Foug A]|uniref:Palmitoyltransferase n=1 Tax=Scleroderma citrinum Foug A TaxID=1036808 RepID=A0A0C2ZYL6_9AGAM|nr:hypothetical protein SCLCIDRAFT_1132611 [Scleroderma citrinum Foug A]